jgi:hypothetical protein
MREHSSAGSEHLPYKQRVTGSNPVAPTNKDKGFRISETFFFGYMPAIAPKSEAESAIRVYCFDFTSFTSQ